MKKIHHIVFIALAWASALNAQVGSAPTQTFPAASEVNVRYVKQDGSYQNDGLSWANAKQNIQDAINDLVNKGITGEVWVQGQLTDGAGNILVQNSVRKDGIYTPTESTEQSGGNVLYMAFKIPAGITVRGGFKGTETTSDTVSAANPEYASKQATHREVRHYTSIGWYYVHRTTLSGNLSQEAEFAWVESKHQYNTTFYGNCYHVVWFAMNGFDANGRANALTLKGNTGMDLALLEGCDVTGGNAYNRDLQGHPHNAYGGGIYMVQGAGVQNCYVHHCEATRDGGGIYMDGGGRVHHTYVADCQALGIGVTNGFGGGICMDDQNRPMGANVLPMLVMATGVTGNVSRVGGGLATHVPHMSRRNLVAVQSLLASNNTALTEGGGIYCDNGGAIAHATIVNNICYGSGITTNGMVTGRSGGLYIRNYANITNTVMWGNKTKANNDLQFACSRAHESDRPRVSYSMLSKADYVDWSGVVKQNVKKLGIYNTHNDGTAATGEGYPLFHNPSPSAGHIDYVGIQTITSIGAGAANAAYDWQVSSRSSLMHQGLITIDQDINGETPTAQGFTYDIVGNYFAPRATIGAYAIDGAHCAPWVDPNNSRIVHVFVDPNDINSGEEHNQVGTSWDSPSRFLNDVFYEIELQRDRYVDGSGVPTLDTLYIHIKEGTLDNTDNHFTNRARQATLRVPSIKVPIVILGGYPAKHEEEHDISRRTPMRTPTIFSAELMDDYEYYGAHMFTIENLTHSLTIDGIHVNNTNAYSTALGNTNQNGAAFTIRNCAAPVTLRNISVSGCTANAGAAILADNSPVELENCLIRNNEVKTLDGAIIRAINGANLTFDHCAVVRNVGYAAYMDATSHTTWTNSYFYANLSKPVDDTNTDNANAARGDEAHNALALPSFEGTTANATGHHCMFDTASVVFKGQFGGNDTGHPYQYGLRYRFDGGAESGYPRFINPTKNAGVNPAGDATYYGRACSYEPHNTCPFVNTAYATGEHTTWGTDMTATVTRDYGGRPDIGPFENHAASKDVEGENAYAEGQPIYGSIYYVRDYRKGDGTIDYSKGGDGMSWADAINGNAYYSAEYCRRIGDGTSRSGQVTGPFVIDSYSYTEGTSSTSPTYSTINSPKYVKIKNQNNGKYWKYVNGNMTQVTGFANGDLFVIINGAYIFDATAQKYLSYNSTGSGASLTRTIAFTDNQPGNTWSISGGIIYSQYTYTKNLVQRRYKNYTLTVANNTANLAITAGSEQSNTNAPSAANNNTWSFVTVIQTKTGTETIDQVNVTDGINGLQCAVNAASRSYANDNIRRRVYVAAGTYAKDPEAGDKSCFIIRDGVDVYGAFPKIGNPGLSERHPLVSQHVHVEGDYDWRDYESIIQPITTTYTAGTSRRVLGQPYDNNPYNAGGYTIYDGATWDGFTARYGNVPNNAITLPTRTEGGGYGNGGGGVVLYDNVTIRNMVITNNTIVRADNDCLGGGVYCNGGSIEQCYIINNSNQQGATATTNSGTCYGGGMCVNRGTIFNTIIANNKCHAQYADGAGAIIYNANFFNNTVVNNNAIYKDRGSAGVSVWSNVAGASSSESYLNIYNSIFVNNVGYQRTKLSDQAGAGTKDVASAAGGHIVLYNCVTEVVQDEYTPSKGRGPASVTYHNSVVGTASGLFVAPGAYNQAFTNANLRLKSTATAAINHGIDAPVIDDVTYDLSGYTDMDYTERIQDCTVDIGAYEYNGAFAISPTVDVVDGKTIASYYVTPGGRGTASAHDPANAGCADKLQKVLDAAGRYKYANKNHQVIVKCATTEDHPEDWYYYATRTTDPKDQDVRIWSIVVPEGVELWGGYSDAYTSDANNGFKTRDILGNPTRFDAFYHNKLEKTDAYCYHVFTFTDYIYDDLGNPYLAGDAAKVGVTHSSYTKTANYTYSDFLHMANSVAEQRALGRATVDGAFITGGKADIRTISSTSQEVNINQYGGAAIVNEYGHIRNCIARDNYAINGGAFALTQHGIISGTLITENTAENGAGVYVFENGTMLSNGYNVVTKADPVNSLDYKMPHIITSTIVNNEATYQGGGLWYSNEDANVRVNSTVIWQNQAQDQANVHGLFNPTKAEDDQNSSVTFYPFSYSAVQNIRLSGASNITLAVDNKSGARFVKADKDIAIDPENGDQKTYAVESGAVGFTNYSDFGYYGLTNYSVLTQAGMPMTMYEQYLPITSMAATDFAGVSRDAHTHSERTFVDIGARAIDKEEIDGELMLRLYVANPEMVDMTAVTDMQNLDPNGADKYYAQEGSSFAYPMQSLQDALDYIVKQRRDPSKNAQHLPFEIIVAGGTYYPNRDLNGTYGYSLGNTFAIPEGVSIYGGFSPTELGDMLFYGRGNDPQAPGTLVTYNSSETYHINDHVTARTKQDLQLTTLREYTMREWSIADMMAPRAHEDLNSNGIIEPWEFTYQTVLSGNAENLNNKGVYHVVTVVADENVVGPLPKPYSIYSDYAGAANKQHHHREMGQEITLNGIQISGGYASQYVDGVLDSISDYSYYHGGAILVDGNRYKDTGNKGDAGKLYYRHTGARNAYGYRNLPLTIVKCRFNENVAGYGGAISANGTLEIFSCAFEANKAEAKRETITRGLHNGKTVNYPGVGGAIYATAQCTSVNTLFANNEAADATYSLTPRTFATLRIPNPSQTMLGGAGGAVYGGLLSHLHFINCDLVNNMANCFPAVYTANPNYAITSLDPALPAMLQYNQMVNTIAWGNQVHPRMNLGSGFHAAKLICNYGRKDRNGATYDATATWPTSQSQLDECEETAWFSAYEEGRGITPVNTEDLRDIHFYPTFTFEQIFAAQGKTYQNCNIQIDSDNNSLSGPNFVSPSHNAGVDGYMEAADWAPARLNNLTDNGFGRLSQTITTNGNTYTCAWEDPDLGNYASGTTQNFSGGYPMVHFTPGYPEYTANMPMYDEPYMAADYDTDGDGNPDPIRRISFDPNPTHDQTYIDIGVYEYVHVQLAFDQTYDDIDIIWVSSAEKPENGLPEGSSWTQPTSDLQRAIETLLATRNGHRKEIRLMNGTYSPIYTINNRHCFNINTQAMDACVMLPEISKDNYDTSKGVRSLTIRGGYSRDLNNVYDVELYPAILRQQNRTNATGDAWDYLLHIQHAQQRLGTNSTTTKAIPIQIDGVTLFNDQARAGVQGSAIYYENQAGISTVDDANVTTNTDPHEYTTKTNPYKLILSRVKVYGTGTNRGIAANDTTGTAVLTGTDTWGKTLIYNSLFHSNLGTPLKGANITGINNTFALNAGFPQMLNTSESHNSVYWRNHEKETVAANRLQFKLNGYTSKNDPKTQIPEAVFSYNAYTGGSITGATDYEDQAGHTIHDNHFNVGIADQNTDVINGPNFLDPHNVDLSQRSFHVQPSTRLINKGKNELYENTDKLYDLSWEPQTDWDAASKTRIMANRIDLGAYEYQNSMTRVLYVDPSWPINGVGNSWSSPMGYGNLQSAIDLAGVYHINSKTQVNPTGEMAYVFIKGANPKNYPEGLHTLETLTPRDGVIVIGSIVSDYTTDCVHGDNHGEFTYSESNILNYINDMIINRPGMVGPDACKTTILGIRTENSGFTAGTTSLMDGFDITAKTTENPTGSISAPVLDIAPVDANGYYPNGTLTLGLRNILVHDNKAAAGVHIANVDNSLLYEALIYNNTTSGAGNTLNVNPYAFVVNATVEGTTAGTTANVLNSLINWNEATRNQFSGAKYPMSGNGWNNHDLDFQLAETSPSIDACATTNPLTGRTYATQLANFINYDHDLDLLANPRLLTNVTSESKIDAGAFETWKVENDFICGMHGTSGASPISRAFFPHSGSVTYIMENTKLVIDPIDAEHEISPAPHYAGYTLLKEGASLYGSGRGVTLPYVTVERNIPAEGAIISMPFNVNYEGKAKTYNGAKRAAYDYQFARTDSPCWEATAGITPANTGVLYTPATAGICRFTARGNNITDYVYEEDVNEPYKEVSLTQYDNHPTDGSAHFTDEENQGWNCIGMPYLVSDYRTYEYATVTDHGVANNNETYMMRVPHVLWLYYNGTTSPDGNTVNGNGGFYSVESWNNSWHTTNNATMARLWMGEGFFTQTLKLGDEEKLFFYRPVTSTSAPSPAPRRIHDATENVIPQNPNIEGADLSNDWEKIMVDNTIYLIRRNSEGEVSEAYDVMGHKVL